MSEPEREVYMFPGIGFCKGLLRFVICVIVGLSDLVVVVVRFPVCFGYL